MRAVFAAFFTLVWAGAALAQWVITKEDDAFEGDLHMALSAEWGGYMAGFRCREGKPPSFVYMTPESAETSSIEMMQRMPPSIVVVVDDQPRLTIGTEIEANATTGKLTAITFEPEVVEVIFAAKNAKKRVAFGLEFMGKVYHSKSFSPTGTTKALGGLIERCKIDTPSG